MKNIIVNLLVSTISILILAYLLPGVAVAGFWGALVAAIVIGIVNALIKPVFTLLTIPLTVVTLGLFLFVVNALMILLADYFVGGFNVDGFWWALLFSILLSFVNTLLENAVGEL